MGKEETTYTTQVYMGIKIGVIQQSLRVLDRFIFLKTRSCETCNKQ